jgi:hypothetical protein
MALGLALTRGARTLARREFWTFRVIHAVLGGLLTVAGACGGIFITEQIRKDMAVVEGEIADKSQRIASIERALSQFQLLQSQGVLLGALSNNDSMREDYRRSFMQLGFWLRKSPTSRMLQELNAEDASAFQRQMAEHEKLFQAVLPADDKSAWDALLKFEMEHEGKLRDLQYKLLDQRAALAARRRTLDGWLNTATVWGLVLQQLGFFVVLMAGLIHRHADDSDPVRP